MGDLREIVSVEMVGRLFAILAVALPLLGAAIGAVLGARRQDARRETINGLLIGLLGPLNWLMWSLYNALTDRNGLDTVRNLVINLVLFVAVGAAIGFGLGGRRPQAVESSSEQGASRGEGEE